MAKHTVTLIPGDGIGPEITTAMRRVVEATGVDIEWEIADAGERRHGRVRHAAARPRHRVGPQEQGRHQGPGHHAGRHRLSQRQRGAAQGARPVREPAPRVLDPGHRRALRRHRHRHRPREHRGPLRRRRVRGGQARDARAHRLGRGQGRRHHPPRLRHLAQADLDHRLRAHRALRLRVRAGQRPQEGHGGPQGQHPQVLRRPLPRRRAQGRRRVRGPHRVRGPASST